MTAGDLQALFFDFDGVLAESANIKTEAFDVLYRDFGPAVRDFALSYHKANGGISRLEKIQHVHKTQLGIDLDAAELAAWGRRYGDLVEQAVIDAPFVPGALEVLETYRGTVALYVVSGTPEEELRRIVEARGLSGYFLGVYGSPRHKGPIVLDLLTENGYAPERTCFVGDSTTDLDGATEAGVPFLGRVPPGGENPFPAGTPVIPDLTGLERALAV